MKKYKGIIVLTLTTFICSLLIYIINVLTGGIV